MARIGFKKEKREDIEQRSSVDHNCVSGRAYNISNPTVELINMIGGGFFNEPTYYSSKKNSLSGNILNDGLSELGLNEQAENVLKTAFKIATGDNPEDLLIIASWARDKKDGLKLRTTPLVLLALAAACPKTKPYVRKYCHSIVQRADEPAQVIAAYTHLFMGSSSGRRIGTIPNSLKKGLSDVIQKMSLYSILKYYKKSGNPNLLDVISVIDRKKGRPLSKEVLQYLKSGHVSEESPKMIQERDKFFKNKDISKVTEETISLSGLTWENVISHFGSSKESWEIVIPFMGEMALLRNLRNFENHNISDKHWDIVSEKLNKVEKTNQLPFRFLTAVRNTKSPRSLVISSSALDNSCKNLPDLKGTTCVLVDNSGSAVYAKVSSNSSMHVSDAGNTLAALLVKKLRERVIVGVFGDTCIWVRSNPNDSVTTIERKIKSVASKEDRQENNAVGMDDYKRGKGVGQETETGLWFAIDDLTKRKIHVDRFILLSDLCCYTLPSENCGYSMSRVFKYKDGKDLSMQTIVDRYRSKVNENAKVYSINLGGYNQSQLNPKDSKTYVMSGWSEQVFSLIANIEKEKESNKDNSATISSLRKKYKIS